MRGSVSAIFPFQFGNVGHIHPFLGIAAFAAEIAVDSSDGKEYGDVVIDAVGPDLAPMSRMSVPPHLGQIPVFFMCVPPYEKVCSAVVSAVGASALLGVHLTSRSGRASRSMMSRAS